MLFTVSTVKDTLAGVQRFVGGNLAGGVDHMFVFLDAGDEQVREYLDAHPQVTCVRTDKSWWLGERPAELNKRQRINANLVRCLLASFDWPQWLFHVDGDEMVHVDRAVLDALPPAVRAVNLQPLEAVSQKHWEQPPTWFKRLLDEDDLTLLQVLGVIDAPTNDAYFHGHVLGKSGVRPDLTHWLALHHVLDDRGRRVPMHTDPRLQLLHFESFSGEDFVRKWTAILAAGPSVSLREGRTATATALRALIEKGLSPEQAEPYLMRIYERTTEDDFTTLRDLGLLTEVDPARGQHVPRPFPPGAQEEMLALLQRLWSEPKRAFHPGRSGDAARATLRRVGSPAPGSTAGGPERVRAARSFLRRS